MTGYNLPESQVSTVAKGEIAVLRGSVGATYQPSEVLVDAEVGIGAGRSGGISVAHLGDVSVEALAMANVTYEYTDTRTLPGGRHVTDLPTTVASIDVTGRAGNVSSKHRLETKNTIRGVLCALTTVF